MTCASPVTLKILFNGSKLFFDHPLRWLASGYESRLELVPNYFFCEPPSFLTCLLDAPVLPALADVGTGDGVTGWNCFVGGL